MTWSFTPAFYCPFVVAALELLANPNGALLVALQAHSGVLSKHMLSLSLPFVEAVTIERYYL